MSERTGNRVMFHVLRVSTLYFLNFTFFVVQLPEQEGVPLTPPLPST